MQENKKYNDSYKINVEINKEEILKDIRDIKKEVKETTKEIEFEISKLQLKRRDILVIKTKALLSRRFNENKKEIRKTIT